MVKRTSSQSSTTKNNDEVAYVKTNPGTKPGFPQHDEADPNVIRWFGKRLYLQRNTQMRRLFYLLAKHPGYWHPVSEIQECVYKIRTDESLDLPADEVKRANQRLRKLVSRLEKRIAEGDLDNHVIIVAKHDKRRGPGYILLLLQDQKYEDGQAPRCDSVDLDEENW